MYDSLKITPKTRGYQIIFNHTNFHLYHYAGNNPIRYTDPDGRKSKYTNAYHSRHEVSCLAGDAQSVYEAQVIYESCKNSGDYLINTLVLYDENYKILAEYSTDKEIMDYFFMINPPPEPEWEKCADTMSYLSLSLSVLNFVCSFIAPEFTPAIKALQLLLDFSIAYCYTMADSNTNDVVFSYLSLGIDILSLNPKVQKAKLNISSKVFGAENADFGVIVLDDLVVPESIFMLNKSLEGVNE